MADSSIANRSMNGFQPALIIFPKEVLAVTMVNNIPGKVIILFILPVNILVNGMLFQGALGIMTVIQISFEKKPAYSDLPVTNKFAGKLRWGNQNSF